VAVVEPGLAFSLDCDTAGFAVGVATHDFPKQGTLVWVAEPMFAAPPTHEEAGEIEDWRWPVFFPLDHAIRYGWVNPLGVIAVPAGLEELPLMRGRFGAGQWVLVRFEDGKARNAGPTNDPTLPINRNVNDTALKELIVSGYRSEDEWQGPRRKRNPDGTLPDEAAGPPEAD
jgi:hypothetical protein